MIQVKYAPKINISVVSRGINKKIPEGSEARVRCSVDANPPAQLYEWYINNNPVVGDYTDEMVSSFKILIFAVSRIGQGKLT